MKGTCTGLFRFVNSSFLRQPEASIICGTCSHNVVVKTQRRFFSSPIVFAVGIQRTTHLAVVPPASVYLHNWGPVESCNEPVKYILIAVIHYFSGPSFGKKTVITLLLFVTMLAF